MPNARLTRRILRGVILALAVALPLVPVVFGLALTSGSTASSPAQSLNALRPLGAPTAKPLSPSNGLPPGHGAVVAVVLRRTTMRSTPNGRPIGTVGTRTNFGSPSVLWAPETRPGWVGGVSQLAGNHRLGWIAADDAHLERVDWELRVSLATRSLTVLHGGRLVERYPVATGRAASPTPTGRFSVTDLLSTGDPSGPYGCCILALSAHSPHAIEGWNGGDRIAIHSTPDASAVGQPVSHGCMRVTLPAGRWLLTHIPLGTPTLISSA